MLWIIGGVILALLAGLGIFLYTTRPGSAGHTPKDRVLYTWQWKQAAILGSGPTLTALLAWQLLTLDPQYWCRVATESNFEADQQIRKLEACKEMLLEILTLKDHALIGLLVILGGVIAMLTVSEFKTRLKAAGPLGTSLEIGNGDPPDAAA